MNKWDLIIIGAFVAIDDLRNGFIAFLASQDAVTLIAIMAAVWLFKDGKIPIGSFGLGKKMSPPKASAGH